jgi:alanyl-tRNA synthetase
VRKSARLEFVCGLRAVRRARADFEALTRVAGALSASLEDAPALVSAQSEQLRGAENDRRRLERELAGHRARALYDAAPADARGLHIVRQEAGGMDELRALAQAIVALPKAVLVGTILNPPSLLVATAEDTGMDAGRLVRDSVTRVGGRGGGSSRIAQGSVPEAQRLAEAVASVLSVP